MVDIDWGDLSPSRDQRAHVEGRLDELAHVDGPVVALRRRGSGYEARLTTPLPASPAELRLTGDDLASVVDRAVALLTIVARERRRD
jgi:hypothetical protein